MKNKRSGSYQKKKCKEHKRICENCWMNFIRDPDEKLCKECADDVSDGLIEEMEDEEREGEQV